ncbi:uncharacterized protein LOC130539016 [Takifugu flavidus]|nr:uncharacterized protein LOC130539016 [Takifugu flavidus]
MLFERDIPKIAKLFKEMDRGNGLNQEEFCGIFKKIYGDAVSDEELIALHMKIDPDCTSTVNLCRLMDYLVDNIVAKEAMEYRKQPFPKPFQFVPTGCLQPIVRVLFISRQADLLSDYSRSYSKKLKSYQSSHYITITSVGLFTIWTDAFEKKKTTNLKLNKELLKSKNRLFTDMVYMREINQLAMTTSGGDLLFYDYSKDLLLKHCFVNNNVITSMNYWSDGSKAVFFTGDVFGYVTVFISYNIKENGLFCSAAYIQNRNIPEFSTIDVSVLLKNPSENFMCYKFMNYSGNSCRHVLYCAPIETFAICSRSSKILLLAALSKSPDQPASTTTLKSDKFSTFFKSVDYSVLSERLLTGSDDGTIRVWIPHKTTCEEILKGHGSAITHIKTHPRVRRFVSLSEDGIIYVWSEYTWMCLQSLPVQYMNLAPISSMCYNIFNNELVVANSNIAKCLGRGTEAYESASTSHDSLLCGLLYHSTYKQVVSACINGTVAVWAITTGELVMEFKVTLDHFRRLTAIAFDGPQRRLITADRKLRLWNFNNGAQLKVLSIAIPNEVTSIVCVRNRVFVSQMDSNIIYNLDINGDDNIFLENPYANGISSINIHNNKLATALTNGEIIVWNIETSKAVFSLNPNTSPRIHMIYNSHEEKMRSVLVSEGVEGEGNDGSCYSKGLQSTKGNIRTIILFLKTREVNVNTATLLISAGGHLYACSVIRQGGLLGRFKAVNNEGAVITTMTTDANEQMLLTGDDTGMIYMWNIQTFGFRTAEDKGPFEKIDGCYVSLHQPDLLRSWQCHLFGIVNVQCDPVCKYIITTGFDCNVQVWRNNGNPLGILGKNQWEDEKAQTQMAKSSSGRSQIQNFRTKAVKPKAKAPVHPSSFYPLPGVGLRGKKPKERSPDIPPILTPDPNADLSKTSDVQLATDERTGRYSSYDMQSPISDLQESSHKTEQLSPASVSSAIEPRLPQRNEAQPPLPQTAPMKGNDNLNQISLQRQSFFKPPKTSTKWGGASRDHKPAQTKS